MAASKCCTLLGGNVDFSAFFAFLENCVYKVCMAEVERGRTGCDPLAPLFPDEKALILKYLPLVTLCRLAMASRAGIPDKITTIWFKKIRVDWERTRNFIADEVSLKPALSLLRINPADIRELQTPFGSGISSGRGNPDFSDDDYDNNNDGNNDDVDWEYELKLQTAQFTRKLLPQLSNLHSLRYFLSNDHGVQVAEFLSLLPPQLTSLHKLELAAGLPGYEFGIKNEEDFGTLISLLERNTQLRHLSVDARLSGWGGGPGYSELCLARALQTTPQLRSLHFRRDGKDIDLNIVFPEGWWQLIGQLEKLKIEGMGRDPGRFIDNLSNLSNLTALTLPFYLNLRNLKQLHNVPSLRRLKMDISRVFPSDLETLADARLGDLHLTKLHSLSIISSVQMREICNITTLRKLTVHVTSDADIEDTVYQLTKLSNLTYLSIAVLPEHPDRITLLPEPVFAALSQLRYLRLGGDMYSKIKYLIRLAKHCTRLTELALDSPGDYFEYDSKFEDSPVIDCDATIGFVRTSFPFLHTLRWTDRIVFNTTTSTHSIDPNKISAKSMAGKFDWFHVECKDECNVDENDDDDYSDDEEDNDDDLN